MNQCVHDYQFRTYCGVEVCTKCGDHKGLGGCFCGWGAPLDPNECEDHPYAL